MAEGAESRPEPSPASQPPSTETPGAGTADLRPVTMVAVDVAGKIRERSPADSAIFGPQANRLAMRFVEPEIGQTLLARAVSDTSAEGTAWLVTESGPQEFHISLWRQRGGEKIRIVGAFARMDPALPAGLDHQMNPALARLSQDMRSPLAAAMGFAELIRAEGRGKGNGHAAATGHAGSIVAAAWRLAAIVDDLETVLRDGSGEPSLRNSEVDLGRLARRVARLADPGARAADVALTVEGGETPSFSVLCNEGILWSVIDTLTQNALRHAGPGGSVRMSIEAREGGVTLGITDTGPGLTPSALAVALRDQTPGRGLGLCQHLARANGIELEIKSQPGKGVAASLQFPASRVLDLI